MELKLQEIYRYMDGAELDPARDMDLNLLAQMPLYSVKGNSKQRIGEIVKAVHGNTGIHADLILTGEFTLTVEENEEGKIVPKQASWIHK